MGNPRGDVFFDDDDRDDDDRDDEDEQTRGRRGARAEQTPRVEVEVENVTFFAIMARKKNEKAPPTPQGVWLWRKQNELCLRATQM